MRELRVRPCPRIGNFALTVPKTMLRMLVTNPFTDHEGLCGNSVHNAVHSVLEETFMLLAPTQSLPISFAQL